jgi:hypothetical protein
VGDLEGIMPLMPILMKIGSRSFRRKVVELIPWWRVQNLRRILDEMSNTINPIYERKKKEVALGHSNTMEDEAGMAKDIITLMRKCLLYL